MRAFFGLVVVLVALLVGSASRAHAPEASIGPLDATGTASCHDPETPPPDALLFVTSATPTGSLTIRHGFRSPSRVVVQAAMHLSDAAVRTLPRPDATAHVRKFPLLI